jgi:predicted transglutaminase-like cysteine proteinase
MRTGQEGAAPSGFVAFCERAPAECSPHGKSLVGDASTTQPTDKAATAAIGLRAADRLNMRQTGTATAQRSNDARMILTAERWKELQEINLEFNQAITPLTDLEAFGRNEYWTMPLSMHGVPVGDCEDFALEKRHALIERGWPEGALLLAALMAPGYGRHAVLVVVTDRGDYVLDNLNDEVKPWFATGYHWQTRQDPQDPTRWVTISNLKTPR